MIPGLNTGWKPRVNMLVSLILLAGGIAVTAEGQHSWPQIPGDELALKDNPTSPGSAAMILNREVSIDDSKRIETHYIRIKIFNEDGKKYADIQIPYNEKESRIEDIRARTVHSDGSAVDFQGQVFDRAVAKTKRLRVQVKTFTLPSIQSGSIIEYSYSVKWHQKLPDVVRHQGSYIIEGVGTVPSAHWYVQRELLTRQAHFSFRTFTDAQGRLAWTSSRLPAGANPKVGRDGVVRLDVENVPALQEEEYMPPEDMLISQVNFYYTIGYVSTPESFWQQRAAWESERVDKFIGNPRVLEPVVRQIVFPDDPPEVQLRKIYARVQQIRYLSYEPAMTKQEQKRERLPENKNAEDVLKHGYAWSNQINLLYIALARAAGFDAQLVRVADRSHRVFHTKLMDTRQLDSAVVLVRLSRPKPVEKVPLGSSGFSLQQRSEKKEGVFREKSVSSNDVYLDPATPFCPYGLLPWPESGTTGIRLSNLGGLVTTPAPTSDLAIVDREADLQMHDDGTVEGELHVTFTGQAALTRRLEAYREDAAGKRKLIEDGLKDSLPSGTELDQLSAGPWESSEVPLRVVCRIRIPALATSTGRRTFLPIGLLEAKQRRPFQSQIRLYPIYFHYPYAQVDRVTLKLPPGLTVESLPTPQELEGPAMDFHIEVRKDSGKVSVERRLAIHAIYFSTEYYQSLRAFFQKVRASDDEQVVLQQRQTAQRD
jgi:hypothetical protein